DRRSKSARTTRAEETQDSMTIALPGGVPAAPFWSRRKPLEAALHVEANRRLTPTLSWPHLVALGIGAIIGTGIYTLTGVGADRAGPAVIMAFAVAGAVCACAALAYAE